MEKTENNIDTSNEIQTSVKWWERKRFIYNVIALVGGLLVLLIRSAVPNGIGLNNPFFDMVFWLFIANIFYTCGWGSEILLNYYFKLPFFGNKIRLVLFIIGCIISFSFMFLVTRELP